MTPELNGNQDPRKYAEQVYNQADAVLNEAVAIAFPETPDADPVDVFPKPNQVRAESSTIPELTEERKAALLSKSSELGFGKEENVTLSEQGLFKATVILEGGQPHKIMAEARMVIEDTEAEPTALIFSASPHREIKSDAEKASAERLFGHVPATEYEVAREVARQLPGFEELRVPYTINAAYNIDNGFSVSSEPSGQLQRIGNVGEIPVILMRIDRNNQPDGKYTNQPTNADVVNIVDQSTRIYGNDTNPIVQVTSGAYVQSRRPGIALATLSANRVIGIAAYGNELLNDVKGDNAPAPVNQLPAELRVMAEQNARLGEALKTAQ